ncbi:MAG: hypothetical protein IPL78_07085 [Chloroflexi bacterium]|nr:hypothetical protein [Chloroflexota bacterium]
MGKKYQLIENNEANDFYARYDLLCDDEIILKAGLNEKAWRLLLQLIQPGDTYQEFHKSIYEFPVLDFDTVMSLDKKMKDFDEGHASADNQDHRPN